MSPRMNLRPDDESQKSYGEYEDKDVAAVERHVHLPGLDAKSPHNFVKTRMSSGETCEWGAARRGLRAEGSTDVLRRHRNESRRDRRRDIERVQRGAD